MRSPATLTSAIEPRMGEAPWPDHEYVRGWGVFGLPFDSGHVFALRVFPQSSFGPYRTVWHRDAEARWSIYADATRVEHACPRYYGPACESVGAARIGLDWTGPYTLHITMDEPALDWTVTVRRSPMMGLVNQLSAAMPLASWRPPRLVRARERLAQALGMGRLQMSGVMPSCRHAGSWRSGRRCGRSAIATSSTAPGAWPGRRSRGPHHDGPVPTRPH